MQTHPGTRFIHFFVLCALVFSLCAFPPNALAETNASFQQYLPGLPNKIPGGATGNRSTIILRNPGSSTVDSTITFTNAGTGVQALQQPQSFPPFATMVLPMDQLVTVPAATYNVVVSSNGPLESLARIDHGNGDQLAIFPGITSGGSTGISPSMAAYHLFFGPFFENSYLMLQNQNPTPATFSLDIYKPDGTPATNYSGFIQAFGSYMYSGLTMGHLPAGTYFVVVSSDQPLSGQLRSASSGLVDYEMRPSLGQGSMQTTLPRALKNFAEVGGQRTTHLFVANLGTATTSVNVTYTNASTTFTHTVSNLSVGGFVYIDLASEALLPANSIWAVRATSTSQPIGMSEITDFDSAPYAYSSASYAGMENSGVVDLPYLIHKGGDRSIFSMQNLGTVDAMYAVQFYDEGGNPVTTTSGVIQPGAAARIDLDTLPALGVNYVGSAVVSASGPIAAYVDIFTPFCSPPTNAAITRQPLANLIAGDTVTFTASATGDAPLHYAWTLDSASVGTDSVDYTVPFGTPGDYAAGVTISNACGQTDTSLPVHVNPLFVNIQIVSDGDIHPDDAVSFIADTNSSAAFSYAWKVDDVSFGGDVNPLDTSFAAAGNHSVEVTIHNDYANATATLPVEVKPHLPDLSSSHIAVSPLSITNIGETLTYTLSLHNSGLVSADATLNDPIPAHTVLVDGSPSASDGGAVTLQAGALVWAGQIAPAGTVTVTYQVTTLPTLQIGDKVVNTAALQDGFGTSIPLVVESVYNPYFTLSILNGALATNHNPVTLSYTWDSSKAITYVQFSNDGGFGIGPNTSPWIAVNQANPIVPSWTLDVMGNTLMPRTVYARFKDSSENVYGPISDDIIFDATPPQVTKVEILTGGNLAPASGSSVTVRVTSSDDNSGVASILLSDDVAFSHPVQFSASGAVTDIPWTLSATGKVYVRVSDKAGNASTIRTEQGPIVQIFISMLKH